MKPKSNSIKALAEELGFTEDEIRTLRKAGWSPTRIRESSPDRLRLGILKAGIPDRPAARVMHTLSTWLGEDGKIDHEARYDAHLQARRMQEQADAPRARSGGLPTGMMSIAAAFVPEGTSAGLHHDNSGWISLGPHNVGGRTRAIVVDPNNGDRIYAASVAGGIWLSEDGGESWAPTQDLMANMAIASMVMDPTDSSTLYAGTGEGFYIISGAEGMLGAGLPGAGVFKSEDGWSWELIESTKVTATNDDFMYVNGLSISSDGESLLAATGAGIMRSTDSGESWTNVRATTGTDTTGCVYFDPSDDQKAIAAGMGFAAFSVDGGATWTNATTPGATGRVQLTYAQGDASVVYACVNNSSPEIWRSTDGGADYGEVNYTTLSAAPGESFLGQQGDYANTIWAHAGAARDEDIVLVGGLDLFRSTNGGSRFRRISDWSTSQETHNSAHADHHVIVPHPDFGSADPAKEATSKTVFFGNDGGIYRAVDYENVGLTRGWENINNGYAVTQFYRGAGHPQTRIVVGGVQDNGTQGHTPGNYRWDQKWVWLGDGTIAISDPTDSSRFYGAYPMGSLFRASRTTTTVHYPDGDTQVEGDWTRDWPVLPGKELHPDLQPRYIWLTPFVLDPNDPDVMLAGGSRRLYRSSRITSAMDSDGARWQRIMNAPSSITDIVVVDNSGQTGLFLSNRVVVGLANGDVFLSDNADVADVDLDLSNNKPAWTEITSSNSPRRSINRLFIDPGHLDTFYTCYGGFRPGNLWKTTNAGGSWSNISDGLPSAPIYAVTVHPQNSDWVYVATESGLFASENGGETWSVNNEGPANVSCADFFWLGRTLICVTHSRGMFQIDLAILGTPDAVLATDSSGTVYLLDGANGDEQKRLTIPDASQLTGATVISEGEELRASLGSAVADVVVDTAYFGDDAGNVYCVDSRDLTLKWQAEVGGAVRAKPQVWLSPDDRRIFLLVSSADGKLTAFDLTDDHKIAWTVVLPGFTAGSNCWSNRVMDNWAYISSESGVYAVRLLGGRAVAWQDTEVQCTAPTMLASGLVFVSTAGGVVAYESRSGARKWSHASASAVVCQPVWSLGAVVFGNKDGDLVGIDHKRGNVLFSAQAAGEISNIAVDDDMLYYVVNADNGSIVKARVDLPDSVPGDWSLIGEWSNDLGVGSHGPPVIVDDPDATARVYVTTIDKQTRCFDSSDGAEIWKTDLDDASLAAVTPIWPEPTLEAPA